MLGSLTFASKVAMAALPNVHIVGTLMMASTVVFRRKALIPIYLYVTLEGLYSGFSFLWLSNLYTWAVLWGMTMLIPKRTPRKIKCIAYPAVCSLHGFLFGILTAPVWAAAFGWGIKETILSGVAFDITHGISNLVAGMLVLPLADLFSRFMKRKK